MKFEMYKMQQAQRGRKRGSPWPPKRRTSGYGKWQKDKGRAVGSPSGVSEHVRFIAYKYVILAHPLHGSSLWRLNITGAQVPF